MNDRLRPPGEPCLNCGDPTVGAYCPSCGQRKTNVRVSVRAMLADAIEDQLAVNRALPRTIAALLFQPGLLTQEYVRGRIVRYIAPFRLYLVASIVFFLIASFVGLRALDNMRIGVQPAGADADSSRAVLLEQRAELASRDTADMSSTERMIIRSTTAALDSALASLPDSVRATASPGEDPAAADTGAGGTNAAGTNAAGAGAADSGAADSAAVAPAAPARPLSPGSRQPWAQNIEVDLGSGWADRAIQRKLDEVGHLPWRDALHTVVEDLFTYAPHTVFLLLPVFALLLKLLYIRRRRYYAEHFVFALHVHAFVFVMMTLMFLLPWGLFDRLAVLWIMIYIWLAMKRVYEQGWGRTTLKWWALGWLYSMALGFGLLVLGAATLLLT